MKTKHRPSISKTSVNPSRIWLTALMILVSAVGGLTWLTWQTTNNLPKREPVRVQTPIKGSQVTPPGSLLPSEVRPQVYRLQSANNQVRLVPISINVQQNQPEALLRETLNHLLNDPQSANLTTAIPVGTHLESLKLTNGAIFIDLSPEFKQGGGSTSMIYRVAQVLYTATSLDPNARVYLSVEGQPLDEAHPLGGEGLMLARPLTREQLAKDFSLTN